MANTMFTPLTSVTAVQGDSGRIDQMIGFIQQLQQQRQQAEDRQYQQLMRGRQMQAIQQEDATTEAYWEQLATIYDPANVQEYRAKNLTLPFAQSELQKGALMDFYNRFPEGGYLQADVMAEAGKLEPEAARMLMTGAKDYVSPEMTRTMLAQYLDANPKAKLSDYYAYAESIGAPKDYTNTVLGEYQQKWKSEGSGQGGAGTSAGAKEGFETTEYFKVSEVVRQFKAHGLSTDGINWTNLQNDKQVQGMWNEINAAADTHASIQLKLPTATMRDYTFALDADGNVVIRRRGDQTKVWRAKPRPRDGATIDTYIQVKNKKGNWVYIDKDAQVPSIVLQAGTTALRDTFTQEINARNELKSKVIRMYNYIKSLNADVTGLYQE